MVGRSSQRSSCGWETLSKVWEWPGGPSGAPGVVVRPSGGPGLVVRPSWRSGSGRHAIPKVQEWSAGPLGGPGAVGRLSQRFRICRKALPEV